MYRTHTCGELNAANISQKVTLSGWVHSLRDKGALLWIDLRDRYGITQITLEAENLSNELLQTARSFNREYVIQVTGVVRARYSPTDRIPTGAIEVVPETLVLLNAAQLPPFLIEDDTDGGDDLRMKYRYLDLRRNTVRKNLELRHFITKATRNYLDEAHFIEVETPVLIKSTPEGARDFVVPSRMNPGQFYALPQSPQTFKQLLMVAGFDRYYQIVKCFRDEDLRADRQPEFTQIDCEMAFVTQNDVLTTFEGLVHSLFKAVKGITLPPLERMPYNTAMQLYGSDKPDLRFGMPIADLKNTTIDLCSGTAFSIFNQAELIGAINVKGAANYTRKQIDEINDWVKRPQIGATGLIWVKYETDKSIKSSVDKFFNADQLEQWLKTAQAEPGDMVLIMAGAEAKTRKALGELRLYMGNVLGLRDPNVFHCLWVVDFPLLEHDEEAGRFVAMHHPFTSALPEDEALMETDPGKVRANAYDLVINGTEIGGGSIRIHDKQAQMRMFNLLGFTPEEARAQFAFIMDAFEYGAPPHGGIAFGLDRLCSILGGADQIRDFIAFPKNNAGRDVMIDAPSAIAPAQMQELKIKTIS